MNCAEKLLEPKAVRAKQNVMLSHGGPSLRQASGTNPAMNVSSKGRCWVWYINKETTIAMNDNVFIIRRDPTLLSLLIYIFEYNRKKRRLSYYLFCDCTTHRRVL